ncbi:Holliday junction resolvase RuvX [Candidatus Saccharibacteria bacterium]|nr:Holliday junction resolvase RuvX [Candidatus Saccharibacteria bacterium]NCU40353.1 Holliday junction resolvase RuvX [Candidatus Saccharibacteria bacterium]
MGINTQRLLAFDVGEKRIGIAEADTSLKIAFPIGTIFVDGLEFERIKQLIAEKEPSILIVGYPRNQSGFKTQQTAIAHDFATQLRQFRLSVEFQDESLTSVVAEERLKLREKPYEKADIDSEAATIILQDYLGTNYGY